ncbi:MAG: adenylosuccinate synthase [Vicinamibacteria bacterium]|nr:adenylosuccinate synthase [Vicinamibacteria bacterium]
MPNIVVAGAQWGDEGKGKIVDLLAARVQVVARYNGGHNAGHTVIIEGQKFVLHLIPSGILHAGVLCVMGNGMVIAPAAFDAELGELVQRGVDVADNLVLSDRAHLILPHHQAIEALTEELRGARKIGTTLRGIGPAYEDKMGRRGIRLGDLFEKSTLLEKLAEPRRHFETLMRGAGREPQVDWAALADDLLAFGQRHKARIVDTAAVLHGEMARGYSVLFEGAQATLLDIDCGTYPFVTSSSASAGGVCTGLGVPPTRIDGVLGIAKAYCTRVGAGPFPSEMQGEMGEVVRKRGHEYGASTGRPRRCGWFDAVAMRFTHRINGFDSLAITKLDVLDDLDEIQICVAYRRGDARIEEFPADTAVLETCEPICETFPGWKAQTSGVRDFKDLPEKAQAYLRRIEELVGAEIGIVSTGPDRVDTIVRARSAIASWFAG